MCEKLTCIRWTEVLRVFCELRGHWGDFFLYTSQGQTERKIGWVAFDREGTAPWDSKQTMEKSVCLCFGGISKLPNNLLYPVIFCESIFFYSLDFGINPVLQEKELRNPYHYFISLKPICFTSASSPRPRLLPCDGVTDSDATERVWISWTWALVTHHWLFAPCSQTAPQHCGPPLAPYTCRPWLWGWAQIFGNGSWGLSLYPTPPTLKLISQVKTCIFFSRCCGFMPGLCTLFLVLSLGPHLSCQGRKSFDADPINF